MADPVVACGRTDARLSRERNVAVTNLTIFVAALFQASYYKVLPLVLRDLGAGDFEVSLSHALLAASFTVLQLPAGLLADRLGRKPLIVYPGFAGAAAFCLAAGARTWARLVALLVLQQATAALQQPGMVCLLAESVDIRQRGNVFGSLSLAVALALAIGPAAGAVLIPRVGVRPLLFASGVVLALCSAGRLAWLRETEAELAAQTGQLRQLVRRELLPVLGAGVCFVLLTNLTMYGPFIALYAQDVLRADAAQVNLLFSTGALAALPASLAGGRLVGLWGTRKTFAVSNLGHMLTMFAWTVLGAGVAGVAVFGASYLLFQMGIVAYDALRTGAAPGGQRASLVGMMGTAAGVIAAAGIPLSGMLRQRFGVTAPFWVAALCAAVGAWLVGRVALPAEDADRANRRE